MQRYSGPLVRCLRQEDVLHTLDGVRVHVASEPLHAVST